LVYFPAIWYIFQPFWYIFQPLGIFCGTLIYFMAIWYIFTVLVHCANKNLATLTVQ
jgi:hypothetical protein